MKATARTVSGRTVEEGLAECESAMAQEKDIAECVGESRIRSRVVAEKDIAESRAIASQPMRIRSRVEGDCRRKI